MSREGFGFAKGRWERDRGRGVFSDLENQEGP